MLLGLRLLSVARKSSGPQMAIEFKVPKTLSSSRSYKFLDYQVRFVVHLSMRTIHVILNLLRPCTWKFASRTVLCVNLESRSFEHTAKQEDLLDFHSIFSSPALTAICEWLHLPLPVQLYRSNDSTNFNKTTQI